VNIVRSSAAMPVLFPAIEQNGEYYMDGGVLNNIDIFSGINKCLDMDYEQKDIIVDIIRCKPNKILEEADVSKFTTLEMLQRYLQISTKDFFMNTIDEVFRNFPNVNYRYLITPVKTLPSSFPPLNFSKEEVENMIKIGVEDGENVVTKYGDAGNAKINIKSHKELLMNKYQKKKKNSIKFLE